MGSTKKNGGILLEVGTNEAEFLLFNLGVQYFGINVGKVRQITVFDENVVVPLPQNPPELLGVMKFRDQTISVVDLKSHLGIDNAEHPTRRLLLVTEFNRRTVGFVIDAVEKIERCSWKQFVPVSETISSTSVKSVVGTVTLGEKIILILDLETIMSTLDPSMDMETYQDQISLKSPINRADVRILHCEDSIVVQKTLLKTLQSAGFKNFVTFTTGAEGLEYLTQSPRPQVDIILSDIEMPRMDGLTFCKSVREDDAYRDTPFIFFSSMITEPMTIKCKGVGGDACYSKPEVHLIVDAIDSFIAQKQF